MDIQGLSPAEASGMVPFDMVHSLPIVMISFVAQHWL